VLVKHLMELIAGKNGSSCLSNENVQIK